MNKIFLIEDDQAIISAIRLGLAKWKYESQAVTDWEQVLLQFETYQPDLVIMDITLPVFDGFYWTTKIREASTVPIIFLSAADLDPNAIRAIAVGADDYVTKPFSINVLISKIQAVLRRVQPDLKNLDLLKFDDYQLNILTNEVYFKQQVVKLTPNEALILKLLILNIGKLVSKTQIIQSLWQGGSFIDEGILNVNLSRLRKKIKPLRLDQRIVTERKRGYRLLEKDEENN